MVQRVSIVGNSGSGKSTLGRKIASAIGADYIELDSIHHLANWTPIDPDEFRSKVAAIASSSTWVIDGNYRTVVVDGPVWEQADTVVWLDLPRHVIMRQVIWRSLRRAVTRETLWNGNREAPRNLVAWDPHQSIIRWSWTQHAKYIERYAPAMVDDKYAHIQFVRLRSHAEADAFVGGLTGKSLDEPAPDPSG